MNDQRLLLYARSIHGKPRKLRVTQQVRQLNPGVHLGNRHTSRPPRIIVASEPDRRD